MSQVQRGARLRRSPYFEATQRYGPRGFTVYNHTLFPTHYDDFEKEYWHLLEHVTLWDVAVERNVEVTGPDGFRFAQLLTCRDLSTCEVGQGKYVLITAPDGGILNDPVMLRIDENTFWFALADSDVLFYAFGLAAHAGLDVQVREIDAAPLQIQGPRSKDVVRDRLVDLDSDAEFMGKDALRRIRDEGVTRKVVGVEITGERLDMNTTRWPVSPNGERVGDVTSAVWSPRLERNIGFAWVPVALSEEGTPLRVATSDGDRDATVVPMPFVDPGKQIPKS